MRYLIYIKLTLLTFTVMSCNKGGKLQSLNGDVYRITSVADAAQLVPSLSHTTTSAIKGWFDKETNIFNFTISWTGLNQGAADTIRSINFYASSYAEQNGTLIKSLRYIDPANSGSLNTGISGTTGLLLEEQEQLLSGNIYYTLITSKYPNGIVRGRLQVELRDPNEIAQYPVSKLVFSPANKINLSSGETSDLAVSVQPMYASNKELEWRSTDPSIVAVDAKGKITALKKGYVSISATAKDGQGASVSTLVTVDLDLEMLSRVGWTVTASSEKVSDGGGKNMILDGNFATYWHSEWSPNAPLPHWLLVDMQEPKDVAYVQIYRRAVNTDTKTVIIETSADGITFTRVGNIGVFTDSQGSISFFPVRARYLKINVTESNRIPFANIVELNVGGYQ